jgi:small-conductance mechanosensitive channel
MKRYERVILAGLAVLAMVALGAVVLTRDWADYRGRLRALRQAEKIPANPVDMRPLETAQQAAALAVTHTEQDYAQQALRLADHSVDLAFAAAIHDAAENPPPLTTEVRQLAARVKTGQAAVAGDQNRIAQFTAALAKASGGTKEDFPELIGIAQAQLALDQDDLEDAQQQLVRSGGDKQATIQQLLDQHKASDAQNANVFPNTSAGTAASPELTQARNIMAEFRAWESLRAKEKLLSQAQQEALGRAAALSASHAALETQQESATGTGANATPAENSQPAAAGENPALAILRRQTQNKANLADIGRHIVTEQQLAAVYTNWNAFASVREKAFLHEILVSALWILLVALVVFVANYWVEQFFARVAGERRTLFTMRALVLFVVQAAGLLCILLVIFGIPSNFATVLALIGAGLTVALKDFIVGFFGWFVLMGKDGIRAGDWVEINGVGGEVVKVGFLHTVLLETGNWTDAGHPTGRQVSFVNSFAIEGHYFNFSTSGQWLWDEIEVQIPEGAEPYAIAEAIQKITAQETGANARLAEEEWNRVAPSDGKRVFSAEPSLSVRPAVTGISVLLRYITRASERYAARARLYRAIVDLLQKKKIPESAVAAPAPQPASGGA